MEPFDPDSAAAPGGGVFGLPHSREQAACVLIPVPFDATTSYRDGTRRGPEAILAASDQVDLFDLQFGRVWQGGIHMLEPDPRIAVANAGARRLAEPILAKGGGEVGDEPALREVDAAGDLVNGIVATTVGALLDEGKIPGVVGGDHSVPFGAIAAAAERCGPLGVLHFDAHADLRVAYEGFRWSHASILHNVLADCPQVSRVVQVGVRDFCEAEVRAIEASSRVVTWFGLEWRRRLLEGQRLSDLIDELLAPLPANVWVTFDIDGLDPALCPNTGTPVPGGLSFDEASLILGALAESGRRIVGFDLVEVAPGPGDDEWDANVGARVLFKLCGAALLSAS